LREPVVIAPEGELDVALVGGFRHGLAEAAREATDGLVVDLTEVSFIDSSALSAIVELQNQLRRSEQQLAVIVPSGTAVAVAVNLSGLRDRLPIFETRQAALES
jgi:anti-anti-sigma factor